MLFEEPELRSYLIFLAGMRNRIEETSPGKESPIDRSQIIGNFGSR